MVSCCWFKFLWTFPFLFLERLKAVHLCLCCRKCYRNVVYPMSEDVLAAISAVTQILTFAYACISLTCMGQLLGIRPELQNFQWMRLFFFCWSITTTEWAYYVESCVFGVLSVICQQIQKGVNCFFCWLFHGKGKKQLFSWILAHKFVVWYSSCCSKNQLPGGKSSWWADSLLCCLPGYNCCLEGWQVSRKPLLCVVWRSVRKCGYGPSQADKKVIK